MIIDSDIFIEFLARNPSAAAFLKQVPHRERNVSVISYLEVLYGCRNGAELRTVSDFAATGFAATLPVTEAVCRVATELMENYALSHRPDVGDVLIAATAVVRNEPLATGKRKHFDFIPGLQLKLFRP